MDVLKSAYRVLVTPFLDFVFPPFCISCNEPVADTSQRVCERCWSSLQRVNRDHPLYVETRAKLLEGGTVEDLVSLFVFEKEGAFQHIAHALKYGGYESVGLELGYRIGAQLKDWGTTADFLIPIPLHKVKQRERGYNQAELLARGISRMTGIPVRADLVRRKRHTQTQTQLNLDERRKNVEDAFGLTRAAPDVLRGSVCLLIDDVITTGSTIQACSKELMKAGALQIIAASAALAQ